MAFNCGIVGLPNVGKSTLFNCLTKLQIEASNFPFCTIAPNKGIVPVPDSRLEQIAEFVKPQRIIPTTMEFVDIAGLVKGASKGEGLGNQFLSHIREVDAIIQVVRCFLDPEVVHVSGACNPISDVDTLSLELALADLAQVQRQTAKLLKQPKKSSEETLLLEALQMALPYLSEGIGLQQASLPEACQVRLRQQQLLTAKPTILVANISEDPNQTIGLDALESYAKTHGQTVVTVCAALESAMMDLPLEDQMDFLASVGLSESGLAQIIRSGRSLLNLETFFTAGIQEVRAWSFEHGAKAPQAAAKIHSDFEKQFIRAEVITFEDFIACGGEAQAKRLGKQRIEGKNYVFQDGDIAHFRIQRR